MKYANPLQLKSLNDVLLLLPPLYAEVTFKVYCAAFTKITRLTGELLTGLLPIKMSGSTGPDQSFGPVHSEMARQSFSEQISKLR